MNVTLESIRGCLEGAVPAVIATVAADGTPNVIKGVAGAIFWKLIATTCSINAPSSATANCASTARCACPTFATTWKRA